MPAIGDPEVDAVSLRECGWPEALVGTETRDAHAAGTALRRAAELAKAEGRDRDAASLGLLAEICRLQLEAQRRHDPFHPWMVLEGRRSFLPQDLTPAELTAVSAFALETNDNLLRARCADIAWLHSKPKNADHARAAIDAYSSEGPDKENWYQDGVAQWRRAIQLCLELRTEGRPRLAQIEERLLAALPPASPRHGTSIAALLASFRLGRASTQAVAEALEQKALASRNLAGPSGMEEACLEAARWFELAGRSADMARMYNEAAEDQVWQATLHESNATNGYLMSGTHIEAAIQHLKRIPRTLRAHLGTEKRISELRERLREAHERGLDLMTSHEMDPIDISGFVEGARAALSGHANPVDALLVLTDLSQPRPEAKWLEEARDTIRKYPLQSLFAGSELSRDGRVISKTPAIPLGNPDAPEWAVVTRQRAAQHFLYRAGLIAHGAILPALAVLHAEHALCEDHFVALAANSPVIARDRERMVGRGLYAGYGYDFSNALYLLAPQIEHVARIHLNAVGAQTRQLDRDGIENELGLSALMDLPETAGVFGDFAFEIRTAFCSPGANLRNKVAHGLLDDSEGGGYESIYAWWLVLKLVLLPFRNKSPREPDAQ